MPDAYDPPHLKAALETIADVPAGTCVGVTCCGSGRQNVPLGLDDEHVAAAALNAAITTKETMPVAARRLFIAALLETLLVKAELKRFRNVGNQNLAIGESAVKGSQTGLTP